MFRLIAQLTMLLVLCVLTACNGSSDSGAISDDESSNHQVNSTNTATFSNQQILESIYYNRRVPNNFYTEPDPNPGIFQTTQHLKNIDLMNPALINANTPQYEVCSNNYNDALNWSLATSGALGSLVDNSETELYYQFSYSPPHNPQQLNLQRIFKCDCIDRSSIDLQNPNNQLGVYTQNPQAAEAITLVVEYLWTFSSLNNYGHAVISSEISEYNTNWQHTLIQAHLTAGNNSCDQIDVYQTRYLIDKNNGHMTVEEELIQTIYAKYEHEIIETCKS